MLHSRSTIYQNKIQGQDLWLVISDKLWLPAFKRTLNLKATSCIGTLIFQSSSSFSLFIKHKTWHTTPFGSPVPENMEKAVANGEVAIIKISISMLNIPQPTMRTPGRSHSQIWSRPLQTVFPWKISSHWFCQGESNCWTFLFTYISNSFTILQNRWMQAISSTILYRLSTQTKLWLREWLQPMRMWTQHVIVGSNWGS